MTMREALSTAPSAPVPSTPTPNPLAALRAQYGTVVLLEQLAEFEDADAHRCRACLEHTPAAVHGRLADALRLFVRQARVSAMAGSPLRDRGGMRERGEDPDVRAWSGRTGRGR